MYVRIEKYYFNLGIPPLIFAIETLIVVIKNSISQITNCTVVSLLIINRLVPIGHC